MAKRLSAQIKKEILDLFVKNGFNIEKLANKFECTTATITRNLKKELGSQNYQEIIDSRNLKINPEISKINSVSDFIQDNAYMCVEDLKKRTNIPKTEIICSSTKN